MANFTDFPRFTRNSVGNLFLIDTMEMDRATIHLNGTFAGTVVWEAANDPLQATWVAIPGVSVGNIGASQGTSSSTATNTVVVVPTYARYLRGRISTYTSGTFQADVILDKGAPPVIGTQVWLANNFAVPTAQGGTTTFVKTGAAVIMANLKTTAGNLFGAYLKNNSAADRYVRFYNKASAPITTDVPVFVVRIPAGGEFRFDHELAFPRFSTGISYGITAGAADNDATVNALNDVSGFILWA